MEMERTRKVGGSEWIPSWVGQWCVLCEAAVECEPDREPSLVGNSEEKPCFRPAGIISFGEKQTFLVCPSSMINDDK